MAKIIQFDDLAQKRADRLQKEAAAKEAEEQFLQELQARLVTFTQCYGKVMFVRVEHEQAFNHVMDQVSNRLGRYRSKYYRTDYSPLEKTRRNIHKEVFLVSVSHEQTDVAVVLVVDMENVLIDQVWRPKPDLRVEDVVLKEIQDAIETWCLECHIIVSDHSSDPKVV